MINAVVMVDRLRMLSSRGTVTLVRVLSVAVNLSRIVDEFGLCGAADSCLVRIAEKLQWSKYM